MMLWYVTLPHIMYVSNLPRLIVGHSSPTLTFTEHVSTAFVARWVLRHVACSHRKCRMRMLLLLPCCWAQFPCNTTHTCHGGGRTMPLPSSNIQDPRQLQVMIMLQISLRYLDTTTILRSFAAAVTSNWAENIEGHMWQTSTHRWQLSLPKASKP